MTTPLSTLPGWALDLKVEFKRDRVCPKMDGDALDGGHVFSIEKDDRDWLRDRYGVTQPGPYRVCPCGISEPYWRKFGSGR